MEAETPSINTIGPIGRIIGIFTSPTETFKSIGEKPTWLVPFIIVVVITVILSFLAMDIGMKDQIAKMEARNIPQEQIELAQSRMEGPMRYINIPIIPVITLVAWAILTGIFLFGCNTFLGSEVQFKKIFSVIAWTSLISMMGGILKTILILLKQTTIGVTTSLAVLLPTPELGQKSPILVRILSKFDLFTIWQLVLWIIGLAVICNSTVKKTSPLILSLWVIWIIINVALGGVFSGMFGG